jgi:hypothetical protein
MNRLLRASLSALILVIAFFNQSFAQCPSSTAPPASDLGITFTSINTTDGRIQLTFKIVNTNQSGNFEYVAFQLPNSAVALITDTLYQYTGSDKDAQKLKYSVENPCSSPVSTIKFTLAAAKGKLKQNTYDIFTYEMSAYEFSKMDNLTVEANHGKNIDPVKVTFPIKSKPLSCLPEDPAFTATGISGETWPTSGTTETYSVESSKATVYRWSVPSNWSIVSGQGTNKITVKVGTMAGGVVVDMEEPGNSASLYRTLAVQPLQNPLPVELVNFAGVARPESVELNWSTATEINNEKFEVERSVNGKDFVKIGTVKGAGNSNVLRHYQFADNQPLVGISYYRLKQIDLDQAFEYSKVIAVTATQSHSNLDASLFPNPVTEQHIIVRLKGNGQNSTPVSFTMMDLTGKIVLTHTLNPSLPEERVELPRQSLKKGMYLVSIASGDATSLQRIVIQ